MTSNLGKLERVQNLRNVWADEARDFTPWLAETENLSQLSAAIGFGTDGLELVGTEVPVGGFSADILCLDTRFSDERYVVIENQLTKSEHDHLGKVITYAGGLQATSVIIVADRFRDEHRTALNWLNEASKDDYNFFAVEIELWRIGDSAVAPKFEIVVEPDNWLRDVQYLAQSENVGEQTEHQKRNIRYWTEFANLCRDTDSPLQVTRKPSDRNYFGFAIGRTDFELNAVNNSWEKWIKAELTLYGKDASAYFHQLKSMPIMDEGSPPLHWDFDPERTKQHVQIVLSDVDPLDEEDWPSQHQWIIEQLTRLHRLFSGPIKSLNAGDWDVEPSGGEV